MPDRKIVKVIEAKGDRRVYQMDDGQIVEFEGGHANWRNNNPGNLKFELPKNASEDAKQARLKDAQSLYQGVVGLDERGMAIFETPEAGRLAQIKLADRKAAQKADWTLEDYVKFYAKDDYAGKAHHDSYLKHIEDAGRKNGVDLSKDRNIASLNDAEKKILVEAMKEVEGTKIGSVKALYSPSTDAYLKLGDFNKDVEGLQLSLQKIGYNTLLDSKGFYGLSTYEAVKKFQKDNGLPQTGAADEATLNVIGNHPKIKGDVSAPVPRYAQDGGAQDNPRLSEVQPKASEGLALNDPGHPKFVLYQQARAGIEELGANDRSLTKEQKDNVAAALTAEALASGAGRIDRVFLSENGKGVFAVQGTDLASPAAIPARVDLDQAKALPIGQSTQRADASSALMAARGPTERESEAQAIKPLTV